MTIEFDNLYNVCAQFCYDLPLIQPKTLKDFAAFDATLNYYRRRINHEGIWK